MEEGEMKRLWVVMLVLAMVPLMATPTWAEKGGTPGPPDKPGNPNDEPRVSVTCVSPWWAGHFFETGDFDIYLDRNNPDACVDVFTQTAGKWKVTVTLEEGIWRKPELMLMPRDAAWADWPSDSCGGEKRFGDAVYGEWELPPAWDERGFDVVPVATVNACPGWDAETVGGDGIGDWGELVERAAGIDDYNDFGQVLASEGPPVQTVVVTTKTGEIHPLAFVVWSHNLRKGDRIRIHVDLPPLGD
jgi:hypothetical protein